MYGFLDSYTKRKAFRKALNNAFDAGYDPSAVAEKDATPVSLGKTVEPIDIAKPQIPAARRTAKALRKPESGLVDLSKHKDWRADKLKKTEPAISSRTASLYDELFPQEKESSAKPVFEQRSNINEMLDKAFPEQNEEGFAEEFVLPKEEPQNKPQVEEDESWENLIRKLELGNFVPDAKDEDEVEELTDAQPWKVEVERDKKAEETIVEEKPAEKPAQKPKAAAAKPASKPATKPASKPVKPASKSAPKAKAQKTETKTVARNKKRKNKIKFDADIIGGW